jgi:hypothetical protein
MTVFERNLADVGFSRLQDCAENLPWFQDLLIRWQPAGFGAREGGADTKHLRLAIRNGYLNFYRLGQSVARVAFDRSGAPEAKIHNKYVEGGIGDQSYVLLKGGRLMSSKRDDLGSYQGREQLDGWIKAAEEHSGREKCFVDEVVACNPNVIDLEMGLPAIGEMKTAPRMDLVALEENAGAWRVAFWEAKLMADGRLRRTGDLLPEVVSQLDAYTRWITYEGQTRQVANAYQRACQLLVKFHALAQSVGAAQVRLGQGICAVAACELPPEVDIKPRLIIDDRLQNASWVANDHQGKLLRHGVAMQLVRSDSDLLLGMSY